MQSYCCRPTGGNSGGFLSDELCFSAQVINVAAKGASILPIGININPSVIIVNPQGAAIWVMLYTYSYISKGLQPKP